MTMRCVLRKAHLREMALYLMREIAGGRTADFRDKQDVVHVRANTQAADGQKKPLLVQGREIEL